VQGRKGGAPIDGGDGVGGDAHWRCQLGAAMHHAVRHGAESGKGKSMIIKFLEDGFQGRCVIGQGMCGGIPADL
jgi:hypothetical protein